MTDAYLERRQSLGTRRSVADERVCIGRTGIKLYIYLLSAADVTLRDEGYDIHVYCTVLSLA